MVQTSTKRRNILKATIIIAVIVASSVGAVFYLLTYDNVTVSGVAGVASLLPATNIQTIQFQDTQIRTAAITFHFTTNQTWSPSGNYSVILKNGHTYNVYISYTILSSHESGFVTPFTVNAPAGQTTINKDFILQW